MTQPQSKSIRWLKIAANVLMYLSFLFLIYYLYTFNYLSLTELRFDYQYLACSIFTLFISMLLGANTWERSLKAHGISISFKTALISHGLFIFAKYVPGKVWVVLGRAAYVARKGFSVASTSFISTKLQIANMGVGFLYGLVPLLILDTSGKYRPLTAILAVVFLVVVFSQRVQIFAIHLANKVTKWNFELPLSTSWGTVETFLLQVVQWFAYSLAFYLLVKAIVPDASILTGFAFPLAMNFALLAVFVPGGIGIRETAMVGCLTLIGIPLNTAITISVVARLWFTLGEVFLFLVSWITEKTTAQKEQVQLKTL
jgi:glycosyltransferase 2 family protein